MADCSDQDIRDALVALRARVHDVDVALARYAAYMLSDTAPEVCVLCGARAPGAVCLFCYDPPGSRSRNQRAWWDVLWAVVTPSGAAGRRNALVIAWVLGLRGGG